MIGPAGPSPTTRHVLLTLSVFMDPAGYCYPSTRNLAGATGLSERSVCTHLERAAGEGWIGRRRHAPSGREWKHHGYQAAIPADALNVVQCPSPEAAERRSVPSGGGAERPSGGAERPSSEALNVVQSNSPENSPENSLPSDSGAPLSRSAQAELLPSQAVNGNGSAKRPVRKKAAKTAGPEPTDPAFDRFWAAYPTRAGGNPKSGALRAWRARLREGVTAEAMLAGLQRYAAFVVGTGKVGTEFVLQACTFLGPSRRFEEDWHLPTSAPRRAGGFRDVVTDHTPYSTFAGAVGDDD